MAVTGPSTASSPLKAWARTWVVSVIVKGPEYVGDVAVGSDPSVVYRMVKPSAAAIATLSSPWKVPLGVVNVTAFGTGSSSSGGWVGASLVTLTSGGDDVLALVVGGTEGVGVEPGGLDGTDAGLVGATPGSVGTDGAGV